MVRWWWKSPPNLLPPQTIKIFTKGRRTFSSAWIVQLVLSLRLGMSWKQPKINERKSTRTTERLQKKHSAWKQASDLALWWYLYMSKMPLLSFTYLTSPKSGRFEKLRESTNSDTLWVLSTFIPCSWHSLWLTHLFLTRTLITKPFPRLLGLAQRSRTPSKVTWLLSACLNGLVLIFCLFTFECTLFISRQQCSILTRTFSPGS